PAPTPPASCPRWSRSAPCPWAATAPRKARPRRSRTRRAAMRNGLAALMVAVVGVLGSGAARAQEPARVPALRVDSLPPLPDSLRLYGDTLAVRFALPDAAPPPGARRLSLEEAVRLALAQNPDLRIGLLEAERAAGDVTLGNAGYLPTLDADGSLSGSGTQGLFDAGADSSRSSGSGSGSPACSAGVTLGYTVFDARRAATYRRLQLEAERFALPAEAQAEALAFAVTAAYLDVLRQERLVDALVEAVGVSKDRLRIAQARVGIGVGAEVDAALALSDLNADRAALLRQQLALAQTRAALGALLALDDPEAVATTDSLALGPPPDLARLSAEVVVSNRGLQALEVAEAVAEAAAEEVRGEYLPTVRAQVGAGFSTFDRGLFPALEPVGGLDLRYGLTVS